MCHNRRDGLLSELALAKKQLSKLDENGTELKF